MKLIGEQSFLQQTLLRIDHPSFCDSVVIGNQDHRFLLGEQIREAGNISPTIVLEPFARNTAPAACVAALMAEHSEAEDAVLLLACDHAIADDEGFRRSVMAASEAVNNGAIVAFGVKPRDANTGYGYIEVDDMEAIGQAVKLRSFVEKPDQELARKLCGTGCHYWNAGIFAFLPGALITAFERRAPEILDCCRTALERAVADLDFLRLDSDAYAACPSNSIDYAIMEKIDNAACVPLQTAWSDLGSWPQVWENLEQDGNGNVIRGDVIVDGTQGSLAISEDGLLLALLGMRDVMAVASRDAVLLSTVDKAGEVNELVAKLQRQGREEADRHARVYRPWGWYERLSLGARYQVKCLEVKPGAALSLQSHFHRSEHWVVVSGTVEVTLGASTSLLSENESTYIPMGEKHRLANPGHVPALLIEVQSGAYLGEDDIVRYEDIYGREV